jgi:hypothetical protein
MTFRSSLRERLRAGAIHFCISLTVAALAALLVFLFWYPYPFRELSGGRELFLILVSVDVTLGPLVTVAIFNRAKPWPVLRRDLGFVGLLQLAALAYGMHTAFIARPVYVAFEYDRFRVVHAIEVPKSTIDQAPEALRDLPGFGAKLVALRPFRNEDEKFQMTMDALGGLPLSARPELWQPYAEARDQVLEVAKPVAQLRKRFAAQGAEIDRAVEASGRPADKLVYVPLIGRKSFWTALVDSATAEIVGYLPIDPY